MEKKKIHASKSLIPMLAAALEKIKNNSQEAYLPASIDAGHAWEISRPHKSLLIKIIIIHCMSLRENISNFTYIHTYMTFFHH